jgi:hypothetical protein
VNANKSLLLCGEQDCDDYVSPITKPPPNNSLQPSFDGEPFIIKSSGFWYLVAVALASGG